jgi:hypothetical protein
MRPLNRWVVRAQLAIGVTAIVAGGVIAYDGKPLEVRTGLIGVTTTTVDPRIVDLERRMAETEAEVRRVDGEVYKQGDDQAVRLERLERIAATRASTNDVWYRLRVCESGNNYRANTGNGYYGAYQASHSTWGGYAGYSDAHLAPPAVQDEWAKRLHAMRGWQPWPACSRKLGLR